MLRLGDADLRLGDADLRLGDADLRLGDADLRLGDADLLRDADFLLLFLAGERDRDLEAERFCDVQERAILKTWSTCI